MPRLPSKTEIRAVCLIRRLNCSQILPNDGTTNARKLDLSHRGTGVSVIRDGQLYYDDPKTKRPKCYTSITPDYLWKSDFIEVKDNISSNTWESLNRDSLNDQIRLSLLRGRMCKIPELLPMPYEYLTRAEKKITADSLSRFSRSPADARLYIRWEQLLSSIACPNDNFRRVVINFGSDNWIVSQNTYN